MYGKRKKAQRRVPKLKGREFKLDLFKPSSGREDEERYRKRGGGGERVHNSRSERDR